VPVIRKDHFDQAMAYSHRSVSDEDIKRYEQFAKKLKPNGTARSVKRSVQLIKVSGHSKGK